MEETGKEHIGNSISIISEEEVKEGDDGVDRESAFWELKQHCMQLIELLQNPKKSPSFLPRLRDLLQRLHPRSLQKLLDYTLFPLLLLFDAAVNCRSTKKSDTKVGGSLESHALKTTHNVSDFVAEGVILCLEEVLKKCYLGSINQMVVILKKLAYGAMLSPLEASEEFREGVIRCLRALIVNLSPCGDESCACKQIHQWPVLQAEEDPLIRVLNGGYVPEECLLLFLQSESASAAVGHWLSLLLKAADTEAIRGHLGSSRLRVEALITLRVLVAKVGAADALAFYLPGIVSQIGKVLHVSRTMISGAAGSSDALDQAIRCLAEYLMIVLEDAATTSSNLTDKGPSFLPNKELSLSSFLEELRHLPAKSNLQGEDVGVSTEDVEKVSVVLSSETSPDTNVGSLRVKRTENWVANTTAHVNKLLCATFSHLCIQPSRKVRAGLLAAVKGLLNKCSCTLKDSRLMLLECLCVLVCDDSEEVSSDAQTFFQFLISSGTSYQNDIVEIFGRLIEKLPQVILGNEESHALSHSKKLLAVTYFSGPRLVADYLLQSPASAARFLDVFSLCFSQNSAYAGSLSKLASKRPSSSGFMHSISEIRAVIADRESSSFPNSQSRKTLSSSTSSQELPSMPPWFAYAGGQKLYEALAGILRLVSLFVFTDSRFKGSYSSLVDILLEHLRKLISELRTKEHQNETWSVWYKRTGYGHLVRQASTAAVILNEMMFGLSEQSVTTFNGLFQSSRRQDIKKAFHGNGESESLGHIDAPNSSEAKSRLVDCIGSILHEYLAPEAWDLPLSASVQQNGEEGEMSLHFFDDNATLHQVLIEGVGVFGICLGREFSSFGFLHSSLYILLENVICSNFQVRRASDTVLHAIAATQDCPTVGHLVLENSDYVIDSVCRQLRHLDLNPHVPNVLSAMLSYVGVADKILPLLEEPMNAVSTELEILGRHRHPNLTLSFLKAVAEIVKASRREAIKLPERAESYKNDITARTLTEEKSTNADEWESVILELNDSKRYRRMVGSIAGSCLVSVTPLVSSADGAESLTALHVIEEGIFVLSKVEEAHKYEAETKETIVEFLESNSLYSLLDTLEAPEDANADNLLLPAMNKIWPFLVACFRNKNLVAIRKCCETISKVVQICGGDFFSRRFYTDGPHLWKLLSTSPFHDKPRRLGKDEKAPLQLPYRKSPSEEPKPSEISVLKVQESLLNTIADLAGNERSAPALRLVMKKVGGVVTAVACSGVKGLRESSVNALAGLAKVDSDLVWLLLADVYYSAARKNLPSPPLLDGLFPAIGDVLPPPSSSKDYLYVLYGGQTFGFDVDFGSVEAVFSKLHS